jgi:AraC-like DNA-binding protein
MLTRSRAEDRTDQAPVTWPSTWTARFRDGGSAPPSHGLEQMVAHLGVSHFARQFKAATGLPPHQYVIARRVKRAKHLLQDGSNLSLADIAADAAFSDQSTFSRHFKRLVGVTPGQFRTPARNA